MVPKIIKGHSFSGAARYLLHGSDGRQADRVAFTETRNLLTDDPEIAWRAMIATARDQERLKKEAGVKNTGRKSAKHVLHLVLAFHPDEAETLDPSLMLEAADGAMKALGAKDHQALIVSHDDRDQPHLHILINRVDQVSGKMLPTSNDRLKMSKWAQTWEEKHGVYCEQRIINNAARQDEYIRCKGTPQHIVEAAGRPVNDNERDPEAARLRDEEKRHDALIAREQDALRLRQNKKWAALQLDYKRRQKTIKEDLAKQVADAKKPIRAAYRRERTELYHEAQAELAAFRKNEDSWLGRWANRFSTVDLMAVVRGEKKVKAITGVFTELVSPAARFQKKLKAIADREASLRDRQKAEERVAARRVLDSPTARARYGELRVWFQVRRAELSFVCSAEDARYRARWKKRRQDRHAAWEPVREQAQALPPEGSGAQAPETPEAKTATRGAGQGLGGLAEGGCGPGRRDDERAPESYASARGASQA